MRPFVWMVLSLSLTASAADSTATFKDPNLEANIRTFIHGADSAKPLTQAQLDHVYLVSASKKGIRDLVGLEKCPNLNTIYLSGSEVSDLTPLSKLAVALRANGRSAVPRSSGLVWWPVTLSRMSAVTGMCCSCSPTVVYVSSGAATT